MLLDYLKEIPDKRRAEGKQYSLGYIVLFSLLAILCKSNGYTEIARFIDVHLERLEEAFGIYWVKSPHQDTVRNVLLSLEEADLEKALFKYNQKLAKLDEKGDLKILALDGKTLKNSFDNMKDKKSLHMLEVFATGSNLLIGHVETEQKSNEIPAVQRFIRESGLEGCLFTMDALHCQKKHLRL